MKFVKFLTVIMCMMSLNSCVKANDTATTPAKKNLVAYYSWSGNTQKMAEMIHDLVGGDTFEIVPETPYSTDYRTCCDEAKKEIKNNVHPKLKSGIKDIAQYDVIFIGSPCWWSTMAPPVATFLAENDLAGKTVIVFETNGGSGMASTEKDVRKLCPKSNFKDGLAIYGSPSGSSQIQAWLKEIGITKIK